MPAHKVVAIRYRGKGGKVMVDSLGHSPRGTRYIIQSRQVDSANLSKEAFRSAVAQAVEELIGQPSLPI